MVDRSRFELFPDWREWWRARLSTGQNVWATLSSLAETIVAPVFSWIVVIAALAWMYTHLPMTVLTFLWGVAVLFSLWSINAHVRAIRKRLTETPYERGVRRMVEWAEEDQRRKES